MKYLVEFLWADGRREHVGMDVFGAMYIVPTWTPRPCGRCGRPHIDGRVTFKRETFYVPEDVHGPFESHVLRDPDCGPGGIMVRYREHHREAVEP